MSRAAVIAFLEDHGAEPELVAWARGVNGGRKPAKDRDLRARFLIELWAEPEERDAAVVIVAERLGIDEDTAWELVRGSRPPVTARARELLAAKEADGEPFPWEV